MSGTQSTITDRFPLKKPIRHGSILNRESPTDKKQKVERSSSHDFDPTDSSSKKTKSSSEESRSEIYGLVQRCVIIQKDDNGFGLTVSGDNPVFVQSVKEDGAAMRAGVQTGEWYSGDSFKSSGGGETNQIWFLCSSHCPGTPTWVAPDPTC